MAKKVKLPLSEETIAGLKAGDKLLLSGTFYAARDAAHRRMLADLEKGKPLPFDIRGETIYFMGPTPARPDRIIGSAGPTTSGRMDAYSPVLISAGLKAMIGKGKRNQTVKGVTKRHRAVYLGATGGAGALLSRSIQRAEVVAYPELGAEAILRLEVSDFPVVVINDIYGGDLYESAKLDYRLE
ncbi:MAG: Fe-S-containing hydro-lyase [Dehalococcoidia bacterium]|jgi:fumarate hydratase subunit beta|nr:MAG: Fe-S-containing hydro-lyase [Dehalococcoidia bacterium]